MPYLQENNIQNISQRISLLSGVPIPVGLSADDLGQGLFSRLVALRFEPNQADKFTSSVVTLFETLTNLVLMNGLDAGTLGASLPQPRPRLSPRCKDMLVGSIPEFIAFFAQERDVIIGEADSIEAARHAEDVLQARRMVLALLIREIADVDLLPDATCFDAEAVAGAALCWSLHEAARETQPCVGF